MAATPVRTCAAKNERGEPCAQRPQRDAALCFWHDPENATAASEARRLGGQRRKREGTLSGAFEWDGSLGSVADLRRLLQIATYDTLALENSHARVRAMIAIVQAAGKLLETGEHEERLAALEAVIQSRPKGNLR